MFRAAQEAVKTATKLVRGSFPKDVRHFANASQGNTGPLCPTTDPTVETALIEYSQAQKLTDVYNKFAKDSKSPFGKTFSEEIKAPSASLNPNKVQQLGSKSAAPSIG